MFRLKRFDADDNDGGGGSRNVACDAVKVNDMIVNLILIGVSVKSEKKKKKMEMKKEGKMEEGGREGK